jgi:hypothetical protein
MTKPPHTDTIELTPEMIEHGMREQKYAIAMARYRDKSMPDLEWQELLQDQDFAAWLVGL